MDECAKRACAIGSPRGASDDDALVAAARVGDDEALSTLYHRVKLPLFRSAYFLLGDRSQAEDMAQEAFILAAGMLDRYDPSRGTVRSWMLALVHNLARNDWRRKARRGRAHARLRAVPPLPSPDPEASELRRERSEALYEALAKLPDELREAVTLMDLQGHSAKAASERLGITPSHARVRSSRGRKKLRALLAARGWLADRTEGACGT